jgi:hypothetical protein
VFPRAGSGISWRGSDWNTGADGMLSPFSPAASGLAGTAATASGAASGSPGTAAGQDPAVGRRDFSDRNVYTMEPPPAVRDVNEVY